VLQETDDCLSVHSSISLDTPADVVNEQVCEDFFKGFAVLNIYNF
jgi:hypothetical protein